MAIDFPAITVTGQTYDYLGIRYTADYTNPPGFWKVTTPGSYGAATDTEINTGTDTVKYLTPLELEQSDYVRQEESTGVTNLDYNGSTKLATNNTGVDVTGTLDASGNLSCQDLYIDDNSIKFANTSYLDTSAKGQDINLRTVDSSGNLDTCIAAWSNSSGNTGANLYYNQSLKLTTKSGGVDITGVADVSGDITAANLRQGRYTTSDESNAYITGFVGTDTFIGIGQVNVAMQRVGRSVTLSGYVEVNSFSQPAPSQNAISLSVDMKRWLPSVGLTNSTYLTYGSGLIDFTEVTDGDLPQIACRVIADQNGWLDLYVSDIMAGYNSNGVATTFSKLRCYFNVVLYNVSG
jgi:hypothetical protein